MDGAGISYWWLLHTPSQWWRHLWHSHFPSHPGISHERTSVRFRYVELVQVNAVWSICIVSRTHPACHCRLQDVCLRLPTGGVYLSGRELYESEEGAFQCWMGLTWSVYGYRRETSKLIHIGLHTVAVVAFLSALAAMIQTKIFAGVMNFYSAHSWVGIVVIVLSLVQVCFLPAAASV